MGYANGTCQMMTDGASAPKIAADDDAAVRSRDPETTRRDILLVAVEEFAAKGLAGARIDEIAARTRTSKRMIYYYFGSKDGLYIAVLEHVYETQRRYEARFDYGRLTPEAAMRRFVGFSFDHHVMNPNFIRIVMNENLLRGKYVASSEKIATLNVSAISTIKDILTRGVKAGVFRKGIAAVDLHMTISALCFHYVANRYTFSTIFLIDMEGEEAKARRRKQVVDTVIAAILA